MSQIFPQNEQLPNALQPQPHLYRDNNEVGKEKPLPF